MRFQKREPCLITLSYVRFLLLNILSAYREVPTYYEGWLSPSHIWLVTLLLEQADACISAVSAAKWMQLLLCLVWPGECWMA